MRLGLIAALVAVIGCPLPALAGLYNPAEPKFRPGDETADYSAFQRVLDPLWSVGQGQVNTDNPLRLRYLLMTETVSSFGARAWPLRKQLSVSEYLIRRNNFEEAIRLLENVADDKRNFLVFANMATAYQRWAESRPAPQAPLAHSDLRKAGFYLKRTLDALPQDWDALDRELKNLLIDMQWNQSDYMWFRRAESFHHKLVELRAAEKLPPGELPKNVDALFGDVFSFEDEYLPGKLAPEKHAQLPGDALRIVQQLLVWLPEDRRLRWLLAEVYNARGDVATAKNILNELTPLGGPHYNIPLLVQHREILKKAPPPASEDLDTAAHLDADEKPPIISNVQARFLFVGFAVGIVFSFFAYWQIRELLKRRRRHSAEPRQANAE